MNDIKTVITPPNYKVLKPITVGEIPNVYLDSLTYAEQILALIKYIQDNVYGTLESVINTVNENNEIFNEDLKNFNDTLNSMINDINTFKTNLTNEWEEYKTNVDNSLDNYEDLYHNFETSITNQFTEFQNEMNSNFEIVKESVDTTTKKMNDLENYLDKGINTSYTLKNTPINTVGIDILNYAISPEGFSNSGEPDTTITIGNIKRVFNGEEKNFPLIYVYKDRNNKQYIEFNRNADLFLSRIYRYNYDVEPVRLEFAYFYDEKMTHENVNNANWIPVDEEYKFYIDKDFLYTKDFVPIKSYFTTATYEITNTEYYYISYINKNNTVAGNIYGWFSSLLNKLNDIIETGSIDITGEFNSRITPLEARVTTLETDNENIQGDISSLEADVLTNKNNITSLQTDVNNNSTEITAIKTNVIELNGKVNTLLKQTLYVNNVTFEESSDDVTTPSETITVSYMSTFISHPTNLSQKEVLTGAWLKTTKTSGEIYYVDLFINNVIDNYKNTNNIVTENAITPKPTAGNPDQNTYLVRVDTRYNYNITTGTNYEIYTLWTEIPTVS